MQYNNSGIEVSYIQNLLANTYIPTIEILGEKQPPLDIFDKDNIGKFYLMDKKIYQVKEGNTLSYISDYEFGKKYAGLSTNYQSNTNIYTTELHITLGNYLRFIRDYFNVDVMPLYNCFTNLFIDGYTLPFIESSSEIKSESYKNDGTKLFAFPVKWGHNYEIYCKGSCSALTQLAFFNGKNLLSIKDKKSKNPNKIRLYPIQQITCPQESPGKISIRPYESWIERDNERCLYLFVQIPNENAENIVIIEDNSTAVVNNSLIKNQKQIPYSDKLIGYLLDYFITPITNITPNITKIQEKLLTIVPKYKDSGYVKGIFDTVTKSIIYNLYRNSGIPDFTGFVDKDVEEKIMREDKK